MTRRSSGKLLDAGLAAALRTAEDGRRGAGMDAAPARKSRCSQAPPAEAPVQVGSLSLRLRVPSALLRVWTAAWLLTLGAVWAYRHTRCTRKLRFAGQVRLLCSRWFHFSQGRRLCWGGAPCPKDRWAELPRFAREKHSSLYSSFQRGSKC